MQITRVDLENVKSYRQHSVTFTEGTNAICGANGAGKSTLLEAIGFALFDALPYTQEQFVREGEKVATVTVHLEGSDGRLYQVVRKCGSYSQYYVYDPELDGKLVDGKGETTEWLYEFFGVEETGDLSALFQDAVGVPQGLLTAAFMDRPGNRKNTFNPLLRVDEYEKVWQALLGPRRRLEGWIADQGNAIAGYEAEVKALPGWREKATGLDDGIATDQKRHAELEAELADVTERKEALEEIKERLEALERQATQAEGEVKGIQGRLDDARAAVERAEVAQQVVEETEAGHRAYLEAQDKLAELEAQRQQRDALKERLQEHTADLRLARSKLEGLVAELKAVAEAEAQMGQLRPQVAEQERLEKALENARLEAERLANAQQNLAQERVRLTELEGRLSETQAGLGERTGVEKAIEPLREEADELDERYNTLSTRRAAHQAELEQLDKGADRARERLANAERTLEREQRELAGLGRKLSKVESGLDERRGVETEIETLRKELQAAEEAGRELDAQAAAYEVELSLISAQVDVLEGTEAAECPVCNAPLTPEHRAELLAEHLARLGDIEKALCETQSQQRKAEGTRQQVRQALEGVEARLDELPRPSDKEELVARAEAQRDQVAESEKTAADARAEVSSSEARREELDKALSELLRQRNGVDEKRRGVHKALDELQSRLRGLPRQEEVASLAADVSRQQSVVADGIQAVEARSGAPEEVQRLAGELEDVGDPRSAYRSAADTAAKRDRVEVGREATEAEIADLEAQIAGLGEQLSTYADLDAQLERERARGAEHESAHHRYLQHIREAEALQERQENLAALSDALKERQTERNRLVGERDRLAGEYDAEAYASLVERQGALSGERATLVERLRLQRAQLAEAQAEVARLAEVQKELVAACAERDELQEVRALLEYLRGVLRDAGPKITQALVEVISLQAARTYADIMADHSARLRWTDDYEILLATGGRERTFKQLSGGEQMAAALSVRLALLREVSDIDIAFFDEPTANLDEARRDNLAEQIMNVKGFSQLFVISHDDTFERDTDHVVRVVKENGVSRVEG